MKFRYSLMRYAEKYGVARASRKYNKAKSYIYFWKARFDGSIESLACRSRRPHSHPRQHTEAELKLIRDMRRRNPKLGIVELWSRLRKRGYNRCLESLWRVLRREGLALKEKPKKKYKPKPYEQMDHPGQRVQIDVKVVPRDCIADPELKLYQYTAIDEYSRYRVLGAYVEQCTFRHKLIRPYTPRHNGKVERSHREDQKRFYDTHRFWSRDDFGVQLAAHQSRSNSRPMRPLAWLSPRERLSSFTVQDH